MNMAKEKKNTTSTNDLKNTAGKILVPTQEQLDQHIAKALLDKTGKITSKVFAELMLFAHASRASDIHLEPTRQQAVIRLRIDGILHDYFTIPNELHTRFIALLKIRTKMRTDEHRAPQDGRDQFESPGGNVDRSE